ncbi:MAG: glycoside hydrolase family 20 zincin-like fold domain-containing protein [Candidatus Omnitrophota bacterium]
MKTEIMPEPKKIISHQGDFRISIGSKRHETCFLISDERACIPAGLIAERFKAQIVSGEQAKNIHIRVNIVKDLDFSRKLRADQRIEAYRLEVSKNGIKLSALTAEGLLRGAATLFQITRWEKGRGIVPCAVINDWPNFRYRCGSDWLLNVEANRWSYDWGDGRDAFLKRIKRKLDFCFEHKNNMVWFDGFGWNTERFPRYASLMKECTRYARRLGIKLLFGGYGGGYGTAYQQGEIYRCGYFGNVYRNSRPYPDGEVYDCCGLPSVDGSRRYGTCLSNEQLKSAKLEEMKRFVAEVNPGFMYIHDIDAGGWLSANEAWKQRCGECRKRWPSDELSGADGQAGAYASWFRQVRQELSALSSSNDYSPARDLVLIFISPLYTSYDERGPENLWKLEMQYFNSLSRLIGPEHGIEFGLREQFYYAENRKKIHSLRDMLEKNGHGHGIHVISFGGGDNYLSDDLSNISGAMAHFYEGAESVCLSNGGMHEEPVQMLNAEFLWNGSAGGYRENPANEMKAVAVFKKIAAGRYKPSKIFAADGFFERICIRLWGKKAGQLMNLALQTRHNGQLPVSHVWWSITQTVAMLKNDEVCSQMNWEKEFKQWTGRAQATALALKYARKAAGISDNEDIHWFASCLEVGKQYAEALKLLVLLKSGKDKAAGARLDRVISDLEAYIRKNLVIEKTDILGGDPGCWLETIAEIKQLSKSFMKLQKKR